MNNHRSQICGIVSDMLDNPDDSGIYPTSTAYTKLEHYINQQERIALGWMHAYCCTQADEGKPPQILEVPDILEAWDEL